MQPIDTAFAEGRFRYTPLERQGDIAIYRQEHKEHPQVVRVEVIRIRVQPEHTWPSGQTTPEREAYPGASVWGRLGFTCVGMEEARALAAGLQAQAVPLEQGEADASLTGQGEAARVWGVLHFVPLIQNRPGSPVSLPGRPPRGAPRRESVRGRAPGVAGRAAR